MEKNQVLIPCTAIDGMFDNEYSVKIKNKDNQLLSFFADKSRVVKKGSASYLKVLLLESRTSNGEATTVRLPAETFELGSSTVEVNLSVLSPAP